MSGRPSYFYFAVIPCNAPRTSKAWQGQTLDVVASADLPTFYPPNYRIKPSAEDERWLRENPMMMNDTVAPKPR